MKTTILRRARRLRGVASGSLRRRGRGRRVLRVAGILAATLLAACGGGGSEPVRVAGDALEMEVQLDPATARVGANQLEIALRRPDGAPILEADVHVKVHMHPMGAMPAMGGWAPVVELGDGRYRADFPLSMGGTWQLEIAARPAGEERVERAEGSLTVGTPGLRLASTGRSGGAPVAGAAEAMETHAGHDPGADEAHAEHPAGPTPEGPAERAAGRATAERAPRRSDATHPGAFRFDEGRLQRSGVRIGQARLVPFVTEVRSVGRVVAEETALTDVSLKVRGWAHDIEADAVGEAVLQGEVLFRVYSPDLHAAQAEYVQALRSQARARDTGAPDRADYLVRTARNRLRLWDIAPADLARLERGGEPQDRLPIRAPVSGYVVEKNVVEGSAFAPGERLYRIAPLSRVWVEALVYEFELPLVREGQEALVTLPYGPEASYPAKVAYVYPTLDPKTRTAKLRLELPNPELALRPDMFANVRIRADRGERLVVPESAVLHAGERSFVFRALGDGRFAPQPVETGLQDDGQVEIRAGLAEGDAIVTSATFLIASESRLRAALEQW